MCVCACAAVRATDVCACTWVVVKIMVGTLNNRCRIIIGTQKGTIILTTIRTSFHLVFLDA